MKRALALLLLAVFISCLSINEAHDGDYGYGGDRRYYFKLTFDHAARDGLWDQDSNRFKVEFNGKTVREFLPKDYKLHHSKFDLYGRYGKNTLHFIGQGRGDSYGSQVDNIKLIRSTGYGYKNYIKNGDFEQGHKLKFDNTQWLIFKDKQLYGWRCVDEMEVGWGNIYNKNWPCRTHVCELDAFRGNSDIYQRFSVGKEARKEDESDYCSED